MSFKYKTIPDLSFIHALSSDTDTILRQRARVALPRILEEIGRQRGEAAWKEVPASMEMSEADRARLIKETSDAYQRNLTQREMNDIADEVFRRLKELRDTGKFPVS